MHRLLTISIICLMCLVPSAQETTARQQILAANKAWWDAFSRGDADRMATIETDDFSMINDGVPTDKSRLAGIRGRAPLDRTQTLDVQKFEDYGSVATMSGFLIITPAGLPQGKTAFSEVWVRQGTVWRIKSAHYSRTRVIESAPPRFRPVSEMDPDLKKALQERDAAIKAGDADTWGRLVTADHLNVAMSGFRESRSDRMAAIRRPNRGTFVADQNPEFRSYGERVVIYTYTMGNAIGAQALVSEVWIKGDHGWQLAHRQGTSK